jgi:RNA polymerase sigma-70 factor (ECF subfamily)
MRVGEDARDRWFREIFEREFDYVWTSLRRLGVHDRDLEDVAQELFLQVHRRLDEYDPSRPVRPWLFAFAVRCASDWRRLARHRREVPDDGLEARSPAGGAEEDIARAEDVALVLRALRSIEMDRRAVFILYELDEQPMKEIAATLGVPLFTAYSRLRLARKDFVAAVRRVRPKEEGR